MQAPIAPPIQVSLLHHLWEVVEETQSGVLLKLNDHDLVRELMNSVSGQRSLSFSESQVLTEYLKGRTALIRDLASSRRGVADEI